MNHISTRPYADADEPAIIDLSLRAWAPVFESFRALLGGALYERIYPDWRTEQAASVRTALADNDTWVSVDGDRPTGFVNVIFDESAGSGEIHMVAVDPDAQRRGIGGHLTDLALEQMVARDLTLAIVATGGDPGHAPARRTYERAGFTPFPQVWYSRILPQRR